MQFSEKSRHKEGFRVFERTGFLSCFKPLLNSMELSQGFITRGWSSKESMHNRTVVRSQGVREGDILKMQSVRFY